MIDDLEKLRAGLRDMPVPEPRAGFVDRVLVHAKTGHRAAGASRPVFARPETWWAAGLGALAASIAWVVLFLAQPGAPPETSLALVLNESREVSLVIDSERDLKDATIHILYATGSVEFEGYGEQHEIEWLTSLTQGANLLSLPVIGVKPGAGRVVAVIEHDGRTRRVSVAMQVSARGDTA